LYEKKSFLRNEPKNRFVFNRLISAFRKVTTKSRAIFGNRGQARLLEANVENALAGAEARREAGGKSGDEGQGLAP